MFHSVPFAESFSLLILHIWQQTIWTHFRIVVIFFLTIVYLNIWMRFVLHLYRCNRKSYMHIIFCGNQVFSHNINFGQNVHHWANFHVLTGFTLIFYCQCFTRIQQKTLNINVYRNIFPGSKLHLINILRVNTRNVSYNLLFPTYI